LRGKNKKIIDHRFIAKGSVVGYISSAIRTYNPMLTQGRVKPVSDDRLLGKADASAPHPFANLGADRISRPRGSPA